MFQYAIHLTMLSLTDKNENKSHYMNAGLFVFWVFFKKNLWFFFYGFDKIRYTILLGNFQIKIR
jgi:hypothetical protein